MPDSPDPDAIVSDTTRAVEHDDEAVTAHADSPPTPDQEAAAETNSHRLTDEVRAHEQEMADIGANVAGEGQID